MFEADDFADDPYGFATNQAGHGYIIGMPLALLLLPWWGPYAAPIIIALAYFVIWERIVQRGKNWADSLEDTSHVMAGAAVICGATVDYWTAAACLGAALFFIGVGFLRRWRL